MKDKEYHVANFATFVSKLLLFPLQKWMNLISDRLSTASIKYLNWPSPVFGRFQNGCNKVVIEPRVVQFWSEIILVITNRTILKSRVWFQPKLHSAQFNYHYKQHNTWLLVDMEFLFSYSTWHLTHSLHSLVSLWVKHPKINSLSTRAYALFLDRLKKSPR